MLPFITYILRMEMGLAVVLALSKRCSEGGSEVNLFQQEYNLIPCSTAPGTCITNSQHVYYDN